MQNQGHVAIVPGSREGLVDSGWVRYLNVRATRVWDMVCICRAYWGIFNLPGQLLSNKGFPASDWCPSIFSR